MSFGYSIGDFLAVLKLAHTVRKRFVNAPNQFLATSNEVKSLSNVLRDIDDIETERGVPREQRERLNDLSRECCQILNELVIWLDRYRVLASPHDNVRGQARRFWRRLTWDENDLDEFRRRISTHVHKLTLFLGQLNNALASAAKEGVDRLNRHQDDHNRQQILDWLNPVDNTAQHSDLLRQREEGTGSWMLNSDEFRIWRSKPGQTLFCPGIPGAGKTVLSAIVVDYLLAEVTRDPDICVAYIYCSYQTRQDLSPQTVLSSLVKQLIQARHSISQDVQSLYQHHRSQNSRPSRGELINLLHATAKLYARVFIIVDALDEYHSSDNDGLDTLLTDLFGLRDRTGTNLFATSRFVSEIMSRFSHCAWKEIKAEGPDVLSYVQGQIPKLLRSQGIKDPDVQDQILSSIANVTDGMFLVARLHMDALKCQPTVGHIKKALQALPKGINGLEDTYRNAVQRIEDQEQGYRHLAIRLIAWLTYSKCPLSTTAIRHALAINEDMLELDEDFLPELGVLGSITAGLVILDSNCDTIRLVHYTAQQYISKHPIFLDAEEWIATACITYLSFTRFNTGICLSDEEFDNRLQEAPLYEYAARNWGYHVHASSTNSSLALNLVEKEHNISASAQALMVRKQYLDDTGYSQRAPKQVTGVHLSAHFGLESLLNVLVGRGYDPTHSDSFGRTPLHWAANSAQEAILKLLLDEHIDPDARDCNSQTPLSLAAEKGHAGVVDLLVRYGADINSRDNFGLLPLSWAAGNGHERVVRILLEAGVEPDSRDITFAQTPLLLAAEKGHAGVVRLLLIYGANPNYADNYRQSALGWAADMGHESVVALLLENNVEPDPKNNNGRTPVSLAAEKGHEAVVRMLLERGVDPDSRNNINRTPMSWAAGGGHKKVVNLLLDNGAKSIGSKDKNGRSPLWWAACNGHAALVKQFLDFGVDASSRDIFGLLPLSVAASNGHQEVVELLQS